MWVFNNAPEEVAIIQQDFFRARDFFEAVRAASKDATSIERQLAEMEARELSLGGSGFEPRVRSTSDHDRMAGRVAIKADLERRLQARQQEDYELLDLACNVLYGTDTQTGLWSFVGWPADAICQHYVNDIEWPVVARMLKHERRYVWAKVCNAFKVCDEKVDFDKIRAELERCTRKVT